MRPFDIELAKAKHPVQTMDGRPVRILCFDLHNLEGSTIGALIKNEDYEGWCTYFENGKAFPNDKSSNLDLVMVSAKKEGWINIYKESNSTFNYSTHSKVFSTEQEAKDYVQEVSDFDYDYIATIKIEWEE